MHVVTVWDYSGEVAAAIIGRLVEAIVQRALHMPRFNRTYAPSAVKMRLWATGDKTTTISFIRQCNDTETICRLSRTGFTHNDQLPIAVRIQN